MSIDHEFGRIVVIDIGSHPCCAEGQNAEQHKYAKNTDSNKLRQPEPQGDSDDSIADQADDQQCSHPGEGSQQAVAIKPVEWVILDQ